MKLENGYGSQLVTAEILTADVTLGAITDFTVIGSYTVPAGIAIIPGQGTLSGQDNAQGRLYADIIDDAAGAEDGIIRIYAENPNGTKQILIKQASTTALRSGDADTRSAQMPFPLAVDPLDGKYIVVPQNWKIKVGMKPYAAGDVVDVSACTFLMDITPFDYVAS